MSRILIEYDPNISDQAKELIHSSITASMSSADDSTAQYDIDLVAEELEAAELIADLNLIDLLREEGVNYIEI